MSFRLDLRHAGGWCPNCNAEVIRTSHEGIVYYECGSLYNNNTNKFKKSTSCYNRGDCRREAEYNAKLESGWVSDGTEYPIKSKVGIIEYITGIFTK